MKYFLDSAKIEEIRYAYESWGIDGVTTNPRHIQVSGKPFLTVIRELGEWAASLKLDGLRQFPISVEINPHLDKTDDMVAEGRKIAALSPHFVIKIPCTEVGLIAARRLELEGIRTNVTLVFSPSQAIPVGKVGALFVSPFVGWKENSGDEGLDYVREIVTIYRNFHFKTEIIVAALRNGRQIAEAALAGADIVTCGLQVFQDALRHPFTDYGLGVFRKAWDDTKVAP
jgi:transaldolase